ncbi:MAG: hypothetical protein IJP74_05110 [Prevotella sp.]|nr:hypothetical protein [Prevotella sp.]
MRKLKLFITTLALLGGVISGNAYTTSDLTSAGWMQVTDLSSLTLGDYYFVFVDAQESKYALSNAVPKTETKAVYQTLVDPSVVAGEVWIIEDNSTSYALKSIVDNYYYNTNGGAGWAASFKAANENSQYTFILDGGKYTIANAANNNSTYLGPYKDSPTVDLSNNAGMLKEDGNYAATATNKGADNAPGFYVYKMARSTYNASRKYSGSLISAGWTQVTSMEGLGIPGYYYAFLDATENGGESGFAMTGTGGRPKYKFLAGDPVDNTTQMWTTESYGSGYAIKNVSDNKYIYSAASWNMQATDALTANAEYRPVVSDGVWTLSSVTSTGEFVGNYKNSPYNPTDGEDLASNKSAGNGKRAFLIYSIPTIAGVATELPANGDMAADTWYYIDINVAADNYTAMADNLGEIVYTTDGTILVKNGSTVTANFTAENNSFSATRYYVKSSSANNLKIGVASYTYTVGAATPSIDDGAYISGLTTIDFTFSAAGSTDPAATFALLNNTAKATLSKGSEPVKEGTLALNDNVMTATFSDVTLDLNSTYTISVAAGVVGYEGQESNAAISTTVKTGVIAEGLYYFQKKNTQTYLGRGGDWGTRAVVADLGISLDAIMLPNGKYRLKNHDNSLAANTDKYIGYTTDIFVDRGEDSYSIEVADGGYVLRTNDNKYVKTNTNSSNDVPYDYLDVTDTEGEAIIWVPISKETYLANLAALRNGEATVVATRAGKSASTVAGLASLLASDFGATDVTSNISNAECTANLDNWTQVTYATGNKSFDANGTTGEVWDGFGGIKQDITGLEEGIYKVSVHATWRPGDAASGNRVGNEINTNAWVYANTATSSNLTQLKSWYAGGHSIDSRTDMKNSGDTYLNDVYVYVSEGETLTIGIASPSKCNGAWLPFFGWSLTHYEAKATTAEKNALAEAIAAAEENTLGFETGEYAPYNNVTALEAIVAAKALDTNTASSAAVVSATTALTGATWTANGSDVECVYNGNFANGQGSPAANIQQYGWTRTNGWGQFIKDVYGSTTGYYNQPGSLQYGNAGVYTMPLKANTIYNLTFKYAAWENNSNNGMTVSVLNSEDGMAAMSFDAYNTKYTDGLATKSLVFVTGAAGNYVLTLGNSGNTVMTGVSITKAASQVLEFADGSDVPTYAPGTYPSVKITRTLAKDKWATAVYPFAVSDVDEMAVLDSYTASTGALVFKTANASEPNVPFLMRSTADDGMTEISLSNVEVEAASAASATASEASLIGVYTSTPITNAEKNYVLSSNVIYPVGAAGATIPAYRAYIQISQSAGSARALHFVVDGVPAAIEGVEVVNDQNADIYNLSGQRVKNVKKGLYIQNGKKVAVK